MTGSTLSHCSTASSSMEKRSSLWLNLEGLVNIFKWDMEMSMKSFHGKALDCCDITIEEDLRLHGMMRAYRIYLETFFFFLSKVDGDRKAHKSVRKTSRSSSLIQFSSLLRFVPKKRSMFVAVEREG